VRTRRFAVDGLKPIGKERSTQTLDVIWLVAAIGLKTKSCRELAAV